MQRSPPRRGLSPIPRRGIRSAADSRVDRKPRCFDPPPAPRPGDAFSSVSQFPVPGFFLVSVVSVFRSPEFHTIRTRRRRGSSPAADHRSVSPRPIAGTAIRSRGPLNADVRRTRRRFAIPVERGPVLTLVTFPARNDRSNSRRRFDVNSRICRNRLSNIGKLSPPLDFSSQFFFFT